MDIGIVILHYLTAADTAKCVDSFRRKMDTSNYKIIIVDNNSPNGSARILEEKYDCAEDIVFIKNRENIGFARGLNVGIRYARQVLHAQFIFAVNNDTEIVSNGVYSILKEKYKKYHFSLLGPMIISGDSTCCVNPITNQLRDHKTVQASIERYEKLLFLNKIHMLPFYYRLAQIKSKFHLKITRPVHLEDQQNVKLHGCFWIFSPDYFTMFDYLDEATFLYMEEDIIFLHLMRNGLTSLYTPDVIAYHKEYSSTNEKFRNSREKQNFIFHHCIASQKYYLELWDKYRNRCEERV